MDYQTVLSEVESWPVDEQARLVRDLCDRLPASDQELELTDEIKAELDRRIEEMDRNPEAGIPWESVKARLLARFSG
jgi:putative addiction module component (TIGR02574 family)